MRLTTTTRSFLILAAASIAAFGAVAPAAAAVIEIQFSGLNLVYDGSTIFDARDNAGGNGDPAESDPLFTMTFIQDGVALGTLTSDLWADVRFENVTGIDATGDVVQGSGGFFDVLTTNAVPGYGLGLDLDNFVIAYTGGGIAVFGAAVVDDIRAQDLPFGLVIGTPITLSFSLNTLTNVTDVNNVLTGFRGSGTGELSGTSVPEPSSMLLLGIGLLTAAEVGRRRSSS
jgi:hypothetical protein